MSEDFPIDPDLRFRLSTAVGGETSFSVPFPFQKDGDITVIKIGLDGTETTLTLGADYTLTGAGGGTGGMASLAVPALAGEKYLRVGSTVLSRTLSVVRSGRYNSAALDADIDRNLLIMQELTRDFQRSLKVAFGVGTPQVSIGATGTVPKWDENGNLVAGPTVGDVDLVAESIEAVNAVAAISEEVEAVADVAEGVQAVNDNLEAVQNAGAHAVLARGYALSPEDSEVVPGEYSALHWAKKSEAQKVLAQAAAASIALSAVPVGRISMQPGAVDPGHIRIGEGGSFDRATYPDLADWMDVNGSALGLSPTDIANGVLPDWRGRVARTAGGLGPAVGETQEDAIENIVGEFGIGGNTGSAYASTAQDGPFFTDTTPYANRPSIEGSSGYKIGFDASLAVRTATETRVKSFGIRWQIKAYGALVNEGTADLVAIEQAQAYMVRHDAQVLSGAQKTQVKENIGVPLKEYFESALQSIVLGGLVTIAHGLGVKPPLMQMYLVNNSAERNWSPGDELLYQPANGDGGSSSTSGIFGVYADASNIYVRLPSERILVPDKNTGANSFTTITASSWRLKMRAWA